MGVLRHAIRSVVRAGDGNVLRDGNTHEVDHQQEPIDDTEEFERGTVKVCQEDGETEGKEQACNQRHEGQPLAKFMGGFPPDLFQCASIAIGSFKFGCLQGGLACSPVAQVAIAPRINSQGNAHKGQ